MSIDRYIELNYILLESKFIYYTAPVSKSGKLIKGITDEEYDALEEEYKGMVPSYEPSVADMVGWDIDFPRAITAATSVYVNSMNESQYEAHRNLVLHKEDYDISALRLYRCCIRAATYLENS